MKILFTWLVVLGALAGLQGRALVADPCEVIVSMHEQEHSGHQHDPGQPCDPLHDNQCPLEHHQHGNCSHTMPIASEAHDSAHLGAFGFSLSPIRSEAHLPPDGPCADLDKPPLI
jgi:hypothetical protein